MWPPASLPALLLPVAVLALSGCGSDAASLPTPSPTVPTTATVVPMGTAIQTTKGTVTVFSYEAPATPGSEGTPFAGDEFAVVDVQGCGGANADATTGITPAAFHLEIGHFTVHPADKDAREPALAVTRLAAGRCARGWITFEIPAGSKPAYVIFTGSKVVGWRVP
jgi:hypothetical protein